MHADCSGPAPASSPSTCHLGRPADNDKGLSSARLHAWRLHQRAAGWGWHHSQHAWCRRPGNGCGPVQSEVGRGAAAVNLPEPAAVKSLDPAQILGGGWHFGRVDLLIAAVMRSTGARAAPPPRACCSFARASLWGAALCLSHPTIAPCRYVPT